MKIIKTVTYLGRHYQRYITIYQDLLDNYYYTYCDIEIETNRRLLQRSIQSCSKNWIIDYDRYPVCKTQYVDPAGSLRSVAPNEKD
jgi:hypothetical protein